MRWSKPKPLPARFSLPSTVAKRTPFEQFQRAVRRAVRDHVRDTGQVPGRMAAVSLGDSPRHLHAMTRLDVFPDARAMRRYIVDAIFERHSHYAAFCGLMDNEELGPAGAFGVTAVSADTVATTGAPVEAGVGLGSWDRVTFRPGDVSFMQQAIRAVSE